MSLIEKAMQLTDEIGTRQCIEYRRAIFNRHPALCWQMAKIYRATSKKAGYVEANRKLLKMDKSLRVAKTGLYADSPDEVISDYCEAKSKAAEKEIFDFAKRCGNQIAIEHAEKICADAGIIFPIEIRKNDDEETVRRKKVAALARVCCPKWWRRKVRTIAARMVERLMRDEGLVSKRRQPYASNYTVYRRYSQKRRNQKILEKTEAVNQWGFSITLAEASEAGVSNPVNRRNELMTRIRGFEEIARALDCVGMFYTLTAPSKYHAIDHTGRRNDKYNGATPKETQAYLCEVWARTRAEWQRQGVKAFGFRFVEPHHDGTPHWHLLLFVGADQAEVMTNIFRGYAMQEDGTEPGAKKNRFEAVEIDWSRGSAAGYVAKYVSKNIDGFGLEGEFDFETGKDNVKDNAQRVEAWASTWGVRQFQQIGSVSVTVYRELRRRGVDVVTRGIKEIEAIRAAADAGDWQKFVELMGGPLVDRKAMPVRALHVLSDKENKYGEAFETVRGVLLRGVVRIITRFDVWQIRRRRGFIAAGTAAPWTCGNNCTGEAQMM